MKERTRFESEYESLFERSNDNSAFGESSYLLNTYFQESSEPNFSFDRESEIDSKFGKTLYLPLQLSKRVLPKVGVFIPQGFRPLTLIKGFHTFSAIDVIVYFHGHIAPCDGKGVAKFDKGGIEYYWNTPGFTFLREELALSGRNALLIAPTFTNKLNRDSNSFGNLNQDNKFDFLINECLSNLKAGSHIPKNSQARNIVLAGHSAGGLPMQSILWAKNSLGQNIVECWGFECLYFGTDIWWCWLNHSPDKNFVHYRQKSAFINPTGKLKKYSNFQDVSDGKNHCGIVREKWRTSIENCRWLHGGNASGGSGAGATTNREVSDAYPSVSNEGNIDAGFALEKVELYKGKILVAGLPANKKAREQAKRSRGAHVEIKESPSVFLPEIIRIARDRALKDKKNDIASRLEPYAWFNQFTHKFTFLGRPLKSGQYVHVEMAKLLKSIESKFMNDLNINDAKKVGDILLKNSKEGISGSRLTSSTATFSMHMFGLAVDVNYLGNPFIENSDIVAVNNVLKNAASLMNTEPLSYGQHKKDKFADRFDYVQALDNTIENYFKLIDDSGALELYLQGSKSPDWRGLSVEKAKAKIQKNLNNLAGFLARGSYKDYFKKHAILDFDKRFVVGMETTGLHWGGHYGDMMHFDMRTTGVGYYIEKARLEYSGKVKNQARSLLREKKYGEHKPD